MSHRRHPRNNTTGVHQEGKCKGWIVRWWASRTTWSNKKKNKKNSRSFGKQASEQNGASSGATAEQRAVLKEKEEKV